MRISVTAIGPRVQVYFIPNSTEKAEALDTALGFEGKPIPLFFQVAGQPAHSPSPLPVAEINGHEDARWVEIDVCKIMQAVEFERSQATIELIRLQADQHEAENRGKCKEDCDGEIDFQSGISLQAGCRSAKMAFPCLKCGRLHWEDGYGVFNHDDPPAPVFLKEDKLVARAIDGSFTPL